LSGKRVLGEREEAAAARDAAALDLAARERRLEALLGIAYAAVQSAQAQVRLFEDKLLAEIEDELKVSLEYYRFGKMESYALLDLHRTYAEARLEHLRALQLYLTSLADLETAGEED
jgi:cobalt-zinc-cadmium efflux system outer membrane protein